jgi:hypothetical protein
MKEVKDSLMAQDNGMVVKSQRNAFIDESTRKFVANIRRWVSNVMFEVYDEFVYS